MKKLALAPLSVLMLLASCGQNTAIPQEQTAQVEQTSQNQSGISVVIPDPTPKIISTEKPSNPEVKIEKWNIDLSNIPALKNVPQSEVVGGQKITSQATLVRTGYEAGYAFTKSYVQNRENRRIGPQNITITTAGEYNLSISAEGSIKVVKVSGGGSIKVNAGATYSATWYTCRYYETRVTDRYIRFYQYNYYSDGTKVATGGYTDQRQPSQYGDVQTVPVGNWSLC